MQQQQEQEQQQQQQPLLLPVGYKFRPTDRELLFYFLKNKLKDQTMFQSAAPIYDIQLYDHHPQIILDNFGVQGHNNSPECYVFTMRHRKCLHGDRANRILKDNVGYWRASYKHVDNFQERRRGGLVGERMNLVYYDTTTPTSTTSINTSDKKTGSKKGTKTDWLMNEYKIKPANSDDGAEEDLVLCKIYFNNRQRNKGGNHQKQQYNMQQEQPYLQQQQQQQYMQQEQQPPEQPYLQQQQQQQYMQQEQQPPEQPYLEQQQEQYMQQEQPHLLQQQQQPAAVEDQAASNTGIYIIDTEIDAHTFWDQIMSQPAEPQQTGIDMISIDDYA